MEKWSKIVNLNPNVRKWQITILLNGILVIMDNYTELTQQKLRGQNSTPKGSFLTPLSESTMQRLKEGQKLPW